MFSLSVIIFWLLSLCFMSQLLWKYFCCAEEWGVTKSPVLDVKSFSPVHNAPIRRWSLSCGLSFSEHEAWTGFRGSLCHHLAVESEVLDCLICNNRGYGRDEFQIRFQFWNFVIQIDCCTCTCTHTHTYNTGGVGFSSSIVILRIFCHCFSDSPTVWMVVKVSHISSDVIFSINISCECHPLLKCFLITSNISICVHFIGHELHPSYISVFDNSYQYNCFKILLAHLLGWETGLSTSWQGLCSSVRWFPVLAALCWVFSCLAEDSQG